MLHFFDADEAWWRRIIDVNLTGHFLCCHQPPASWPRTAAGRSPPRPEAPPAHRSFTAYDASKGGIEAPPSWRVDLGRTTFALRSCGSIDTAGLDADARAYRGVNIPAGRIGDPYDMTGPALFLASDDAAYVTGDVIKVDGGMLAQQRSATVDIVHPDVSHVFGVPGESYLAVLDAMHDTDIEFVICRQEGGAAYMAEAWGRLTGDPGSVVTRGPGATNASVGIHAARENSQPMVVLIGLSPPTRWGEGLSGDRLPRLSRPHHQMGDPGRRCRRVGRNDLHEFKIAASGRLTGRDRVRGHAARRHDQHRRRSLTIERATPTSDELDAIVAAITDAERPVIIVGGGRWTSTPGPTSPPSPNTTTFRYSPPGDSMTSSTTSAISTAAKPGWRCRRRS